MLPIPDRPYEGHITFDAKDSFDDGDADDRHTTQYFEMFCNRGIYDHGWTAVTRHSIPWVTTEMPAFDDDVWELYAPLAWTQVHDLAAEMPEKLAGLQRSFLLEAVKYNVLPLDDRRFERFDPKLAGRPQLIKGGRQLLFAGMGRLSENSVVSTKRARARRLGVNADFGPSRKRRNDGEVRWRYRRPNWCSRAEQCA